MRERDTVTQVGEDQTPGSTTSTTPPTTSPPTPPTTLLLLLIDAKTQTSVAGPQVARQPLRPSSCASTCEGSAGSKMWILWQFAPS